MKLRPLPQGFGAEVSGFDVQRGGSGEERDKLLAAYREHHLLIFRDCGTLSPRRQVEISGWFGPVGANRDAEGRPWTVLHNDEAAGSRPLPFHCDISFMEHPLEGISLHPLALPRGSTSTTFVSNAVAWDTLPEALRDGLRERLGRHYYASSETMNFDWPVFEYWHPVCLKHPRFGRPLLFVTEHHVDRISGMGEEEGEALLKKLFAHLYAPERRYGHQWREGDLLIWDNLAVQHARTHAAEPGDGERALQRVAMGSHSFFDQLERARQGSGGMARNL